MTIEKLARFLVDEYYMGSLGDEIYQVAVYHEIQNLKKNYDYLEGKVWIEIEDVY